MLLVATTAAASQERLEDWYVVKVIDPITDEEAFYAYTPATEYPSSAIPIDAALMVACTTDGRLHFVLSAGLRVDSGSQAEVTFRVDRDVAVVQDWNVASDGRSANVDASNVPELRRELSAGRGV